MYGFETADSKDTKLRFVSIVFLERLIVSRAAVPEFPIGQAAAAPCLGALNRGIWQKSTKSFGECLGSGSGMTSPQWSQLPSIVL